jgi:2-phosphosulfolactate phosphatase
MDPVPGSPHDQSDATVRLEWGPTGAKEVAGRSTYAVVVDVLSFTTTVCVALERGIEVLPFPWRDDRAAAFAREHAATLAVGRQDADLHDTDTDTDTVTLSPCSLATVQGVERVVLPSPNGSTICTALAQGRAAVLAGSLRNAAAVAAWLRPRLADGGSVALVPAGERWSDGSLRPALEDLLGAGAIASALGRARLSPEARAAADTFAGARAHLTETLLGCGSGRELVQRGYGDDVLAAAALDVSDVVPVMESDRFVSSSTTS